jgi:signal transduction histidine kinase
MEVVVERHHGRVTPALLSAAPVRSESGVKLGAVVIFQDITALKQLQHLRQDFMALVAHDLRTPLQSVLLQIEAIMHRAAGDAASVPLSALQMMKRNSQRLDRLVRDLLDASRVDAQGIRLDVVTVHLPELVSSIVSQVAGALGTHPVVVVVNGAPPPVKADPLRLEQVVTNLLENAGKYSDEGAPIRILIEPAGRGAALSVEDHGPGMSPEELPRLFDRYFQTQRARMKRRGLGLGLFITKGLVEAHGGTISVDSVPGTGSTFRVWLPAAQ